MAVNLPGQIIIPACTVTFNNVSLGYNAGVKVIHKRKLVDITAAQTYQQSLGARLTAVDVSVEVTLREWLKETFKLAFPWYGGSGALLAMPAVLGADLYDYAQALVVHPTHMGDATLDHTFAKAVCVDGYEFEADGQKQAGFKLTFRIFPDRTQLPNLVAGTAAT